MFRRIFLKSVATMGTAGIASAASMKARENESATYSIEGFTCVTCAVGLQVLLREQPGVVRAVADYPSRRVDIGYDSSLTNRESLEKFIATTGFRVVHPAPR